MTMCRFRLDRMRPSWSTYYDSLLGCHTLFTYVEHKYYAARALRTYLQSLLKRARSADNQRRHIWRHGGMAVKTAHII